jgi:hypothetical protein
MIKEYAKFVLGFPIELVYDGINISVLRYLSYSLLSKASDKDTCKENIAEKMHIHQWHDNFSLNHFIIHHGKEVGLGLIAISAISVVTFCVPCLPRHFLWETATLPVTFVSKVGNFLTDYALGIDIVPQAIFPINYYEMGHSAFNLYWGIIEPVKHILFDNYCADEKYHQYVIDGIRNELILPVKVVESVLENAVNISISTVDYIYDSVENWLLEKDEGIKVVEEL